ncbi:MAG: efflux RND transporter periplasmic adaptor subunit, partial [Candidatus Aminicenantes bacterium]|nr:efflux RND transporter periplasmic adaptor subunit [Candidatus Aminicenantes bacterium]
FRHYFTVQGTVESDANILVPPLTPGLVTKVAVKAGDRVVPGQLLAELDAAVLKSSIAEVELSLNLARTLYERRERLWAKKIGSELEYLQAKSNKDSLEKRLATLQEQLNLARVTAPIEATVDEVRVKEGEMAAAGLPAFRLVQLSRLKIKAELAENFIARVKAGDPVAVSLPVLGRTFDSRVTAVSQVIDPSSRTFKVEVAVGGAAGPVKPNMLAVLTVNDYTNPSALVVPSNIVQQTGAEKFLFAAVQENGRWTARRRVVRTGESYADRVEILDGLAAGDRVVTFGFQKIADGQPLSFAEGR